MAFQLILGFLQILDILGVMYQPLVKHGFEYTSFMVGVNLIWPMVGLLVLSVVHSLRSKETRSLLACAPILFAVIHPELGLSLASLSYVAVSLIYTENKRRFFHALLMVLTLFNSLGVIHYGMLLPLGVPSPFTGLASLQLNVHYVLATVAPFLVFPFLYSWFLKPLIDTAFVLPRHRVLERRVDGFSRLLLAFAVYLSIYSAVYPYFPAINPKQMLFAADIQRYTAAIEMRFNAETTLLEVIGMGRAFFYLFFNAFQRILGLEVQQALSALPILLNPLFVLASYFFLWECFRNSRVAAWGSFFASTGFVVTLGTSIFLVSNNLALVLALFSLGLLFRAIRLRDRLCLVAASLFGGLLVFTHPWTMGQYLAGVLALVLYLWLRGSGGDGHALRCVIGYLAVVGVSELSASLLSVNDTGASVASSAVQGLLASNLVWSSTLYGFFTINAGLLSNVVLMVLAAVGLFLLGRKDSWEVYVYALVFLSSIVFLFGDGVVKTRLIFNVPFGFFAALGLDSLRERGGPVLPFFVVAYSLFYLFVSVGYLFL